MAGLNLSLEEFLQQNQSLIMAIHKALYPEISSPSMNSMVNSPWALCKLIGDFMTRCLSPESEAEAKIRRLFLNIVFSNGPRSVHLRKELAAQYYASGASDAPYYNYIVPKHTSGERAKHFNQFWHEAQAALLNTMREKIDMLVETKKLFKEQINSSNSKIIAPLTKQFDEYIKEIHEAVSLLSDISSKIDTSCYRVHRNFHLIQEEINVVLSKIQQQIGVTLKDPSPREVSISHRLLPGSRLFKDGISSSSSSSSSSSPTNPIIGSTIRKRPPGSS